MIYYPIGDKLLTRAELVSEGFAEELSKVGAAQRRGMPLDTSLAPAIIKRFGREAFLALQPASGSPPALLPDASVKNGAKRTVAQLSSLPQNWEPIGIGLPLSIVIRAVYTGRYPGNKPKDMLVTSVIKSWATNDATARALNYLEEKVERGSKLERPSPQRAGTPVAYYSPALTENSLTMGLELTFDKFPEEVFTQVSDAFRSVAQIPLFLPSAPFLIAGSILLKLFGKVAESIIDRTADLSAIEPIDFSIGGVDPAVAGYRLLTRGDVDRVDPKFRSEYALDSATGKVVSKGDPSMEYKGDIPYFIIALDGRSYKELEKFTPAAVTSTELSRFMKMRDGQNVALEAIVDALQLASDLKARREIDGINDQLADPKLPASRRPELETRRDALAKNINEPLLKPPATGASKNMNIVVNPVRPKKLLARS
jgi:hypothetical protein